MATQPLPNPPPGFDDLSKEEQIAYLQELWNRIAANEEEVPVPDWHLQLLRERLSTGSGEDASSWESLRERLKSRRDG